MRICCVPDHVKDLSTTSKIPRRDMGDSLLSFVIHEVRGRTSLFKRHQHTYPCHLLFAFANKGASSFCGQNSTRGHKPEQTKPIQTPCLPRRAIFWDSPMLTMAGSRGHGFFQVYAAIAQIREHTYMLYYIILHIILHYV
jgi:hypothetical protein